jgi:hypothetical protein
LIIIFAVIVTTLAPQPALAALCSGPLTINDIQPRTAYNTTSVNIVVTGPAFNAGTIVALNNYGALNTTVTITPPATTTIVITATLPVGVPPGVYQISVIDPVAGTATCPNVLTVTAPTNTPEPTVTNTPAPTAFLRPILAVDSYAASSTAVTAGQDLDFEITLVNWGSSAASNIVANFGGADFQPRVTGGVRVSAPLAPNEKYKVFQPLTAATGIAGKPLVTLEVKVAYTDANGTAYSETFTITFPVAKPSGPFATATPTASATPSPRSQLLITNYDIDVDFLKPGARFTLTLDVQNAGGANAQKVTAILGGGSSTGASGGTGSGGTPSGPGSGGVSGASGSFDNFAPIESSNVQFIGDLAPGASLTIKQTLIVNASTKPGAYPVKFSFAYTDVKGNSYTDDQVITLLVYSPPFVDVSFYRDPGPLFANQPNLLPIQIVNLGRSSSVLGNMKVTGEGAEFSNNSILIGNLDVGGYFTLDANAIPSQPGPLELTVTVDYVDDFNQPQVITKTLTVEVLDAPVVEPGFPNGQGGGGFEPTPAEPESLWQKILRFISGLLGFDSGTADSGGGEQLPPPGEGVPVPVEVKPGG